MDSITVAHPAPPADILAGASLFLDFDGTLVELAARPDAVRVSARLKTLMRRLLMRLDGRVAIVSGRAAADVRALFGEPGFVVSGSHGMEFHFPDGEAVLAPRPESLTAVLGAMRDFASARPGVIVEDKPLGAALHFRALPEAGPDCVSAAADLAARHGLRLQSGKMMIEVRADGGDKGLALRRLMTRTPMAGTRPVFLGDDDTDEPGFVAAAELGGAGILVGSDRVTAARYRLADVTAVLDWLEQAA